jgi:hypothetical protein
MKKAKLVFATLAGISVLSVAFAMASEENAADAKMMASDITLAQKHFKAINENRHPKEEGTFRRSVRPQRSFCEPTWNCRWPRGTRKNVR